MKDQQVPPQTTPYVQVLAPSQFQLPLRHLAIGQVVWGVLSWILFYHFWYFPILTILVGAVGIYATLDSTTPRLPYVRAHYYGTIVLLVLLLLAFILWFIWAPWSIFLKLISILFDLTWLGLTGWTIKRSRAYQDELS